MENIQVGSSTLNLELLNRNNYKKWRLRLKTYLLSEDLWGVEANTEPPKPEDDEAGYKAWTKKNAKALYAIQNSCGLEMFPFISETESAKRAWEALEQECKVSQEYDENNDDHSERYNSFIGYVWSGLWDKAKNCLGKIDVRSVIARPLNGRRGHTALHVAATEGYAHIVKDLVQLMIMTPEDWKTKTDSGHTALHQAAGMGHVHVVKELPVPLMGEVKDKDGDTALHVAVQEGKVDVVKELVMLMRVEDLKIKNDAGYTPLHLAVNKGNMPMVKEFVTREKGENNIKINKDDFERYIPFTSYVESGDWDKANECLGELDDDPCGAVTAVDPREDEGNTALHVAACCKGHVEVTKGLVSLLKTRQDHLELKTAEDFITFGSRITLGVSEELLMEKAKYMVEQYQKTLFCCLEIQNAKGSTALRLAVLVGNVDVVQALAPMMRQEGLELKSLSGSNALHQAVAYERKTIVDVLLPLMRKEGLETTDDDGETPLNYAIIRGNVDIVKELVQSMRLEGLETRNRKGYNALHQAVKNGHMHIAKMLIPLMRPEALEEKDYYDSTALSWAIARLMDGDVYGVAKNMVARNDKVLGIPSDPDDDIPVVEALRWRKWELARYLYSVTPPELLNGTNGSSIICYCLNTSELIDMARHLLDRFPNLAVTVTKSGSGDTSPMWKLSRMSYAFLSGSQLTRCQRWIYNRMYVEVAQVNIQDISINVAPSEDDHQSKRDLISSVINLFRRFAECLRERCGIHNLYKIKSTHRQIFEILKYMAEATKNDDLSQDQLDTVKTSFFTAIQQGYFEFVTHICKENPKLLGQLLKDRGVKGIFHFAIECRQKEVYSLIFGLEEKERRELGIFLVNGDYNLLHYAANLSSRPQFDDIQDAGLQMQRELQWFKEVESFVPLDRYEHRNRSDDMTARELFTKNHKKLITDAESSIKGTATSCTVVGALIVTMMFAAAFTIPGGNDGNKDRPLLKVYVVSDTISLVSSTSSVITFLGILTSRYAEKDFLKSLPTKIMIGLITLFSSIVSMMIVFSCALVILFDREAWIVTLSILFTSVPVILFVWLLFPLLIKTFMSTYGPGIFDKKKKKNITIVKS